MTARGSVAADRVSSPLTGAVETVQGFRSDTLPAVVLDRASTTWRDAVAVMVGGTTSVAAEVAASYARTIPGDTALLAGGRTLAAFAAFANATAAAALDFEDGHAEGGAMHPASPIIPAVLAAADKKTTMRDAWVAQIAGYEIALRIGWALLVHGNSPWFHSSGAPGALGAAVAVSHLRGYDTDMARRAAHIAWLHAPFSTGGWPMIKESIGWGAMTGLSAADLAGLGMNALPPGYQPIDVNINPETPLSLPGVDDAPFLTQAGAVFQSLQTYFKPFAACRWTHSAADGLGVLMRRHAIDPAAIERIEVFTHEGATHLVESEPKTIEHGQYSFQMVLSAVALEGKASWREMSVAAMRAPRRLEMARRVFVSHDPAFDRYVPAKLPARVSITLQDGMTVSDVFIDSLGENDHPMTDDQLHDKWSDLLAARLATGDAERLLHGLRDPDARLLDVMAPLLAPIQDRSAR